ncbi:acyloxyacyl hydrolase [Flavobacterium mekongense]|uniref:acyloxyacyl hydrolase n=1 Tax=Flavobacterium mekongense TaxID=3379707 RepID=UPI00399C212F
MKTTVLWVVIFTTICTTHTQAQYAYGDKWYNNPLGFEPVKLHTSMGFIIPAAVVGTCLLFTKNNPELKNRISIYNEIGLSWGYKYPNTFLPQNNTGINYQLRKFMSVGVECNVVFAKDDFNATTGFAIRPFARFYPINTEKWRLYFESGGGLIYTLTEFPKATNEDSRKGLKLNGITKYGIGTDINITKKTAIMFGIRHIHISNGNTKGVERNPSHDSNGFFIGLSHFL